MNAIFIIIFILSVGLLTAVSPDAATAAMLSGATDAIGLSVKMLAIYAVWLSVLKIAEATKLDKKLSRAFRPITKRLFKNESDEAYDYIAVNLAANFIGIGGAATPAGINAINAMDTGSGVATKNMIMLTVISATSIQLIPVTVMSLMSAAGSAAPSAILLPSIISTAVSTAVGIVLVKVFVK